MWKNFPAPGVQEIHAYGRIVRSSIVVQKKNSESFGQQFWFLALNSLIESLYTLYFPDKQTERASSFVHPFSAVAILKLLL
jgi:hypothetical protein